MPKELTKIVLTKEDIRQMVALRYNLALPTCTININHFDGYSGDPRETAYTNITVEGEKNHNNDR